MIYLLNESARSSLCSITRSASILARSGGYLYFISILHTVSLNLALTSLLLLQSTVAFFLMISNICLQTQLKDVMLETLDCLV